MVVTKTPLYAKKQENDLQHVMLFQKTWDVRSFLKKLQIWNRPLIFVQLSELGHRSDGAPRWLHGHAFRWAESPSVRAESVRCISWCHRAVSVVVKNHVTLKKCQDNVWNHWHTSNFRCCCLHKEPPELTKFGYNIKKYQRVKASEKKKNELRPGFWSTWFACGETKASFTCPANCSAKTTPGETGFQIGIFSRFQAWNRRSVFEIPELLRFGSDLEFGICSFLLILFAFQVRMKNKAQCRKAALRCILRAAGAISMRGTQAVRFSESNWSYPLYCILQVSTKYDR